MLTIRQKKIIRLLEDLGGSATIDNLMTKLYISKSTLRRDLISLEKTSVVQRFHGGVCLVESGATESPISKRRMQNLIKKSFIAHLAGKLLHDNMVIFLDSSSTVNELCPLIRHFQNITVITNGINIAEQLNFYQNIICYICPGTVKHKSLSIIGQYAIDFIGNFTADAVFLSSKAILPSGIFEGDDAQALIKRAMMRQAKKIYLLCDDTKESTSGFFKLEDYRKIDLLLTSQPLSPTLSQIISEEGCKIVYE